MAALPQHPAPTRSGFELAVVDMQDDRVSIRAAGELDAGAREELSNLLASELAAGRVFVRMDLSQVTSLDGSCLGTLKSAHDGCIASQGVLLLEGLCEGARQVLVAGGLDRCLFLAGTAGPPEWLPNLPGLADLIRHECAGVSPALVRGTGSVAVDNVSRQGQRNER
jgi:anti-anti-sigma factor